MRGIRLFVLGAVASAALAAGTPAAEGAIVFVSPRCEDAADYERRGIRPLFPGDPEGFCQAAIWRVEDDGSGMRRLTAGMDDEARGTSGDGEPAWSPDARTILYTHSLRSASGGSRIFTMNADGSGQRQLSQTGAEGFSFEMSPTFSPDGTRILFTTSTNGNLGGKVTTMAADGSDVRRLELGPGSYFGPAWAPDGTRIAFVRDVQGDAGTPGLHTANLDGSDQRRLTHGDLGVGRARVEFSPDGENILFGAIGQVMLARADGLGVRALARGGGGTWVDDRRILFAGRPPGQQAGLFALDITAPSNLRRITTGPDGDPDWSGLTPAAERIDRAGPAVLVADQVFRSVDDVVGVPEPGSRHRLRYLAVDRSGVSSVRVALARHGRRGRCRYFRGGHFTSSRRCARLAWMRIRSGGVWKRQLEGLPDGRYTVRFRARDTFGRTATTKPLRLAVSD